MPGGQPSTTHPSAGPWLSPQVVTRNRCPKVLCDMAAGLLADAAVTREGRRAGRSGRPGGGEFAELDAGGAFGGAGIGDQADEEAALRVASARPQTLGLEPHEATLGDLAADP